MAPLPTFLFRLASAFAAEHITRRLVASPLFNRMIARMLHEVDHIPHRLNGRQVPPYTPPVGSQFDVPQQDYGEPHDEPDPFAAARKTSSSSRSQASMRRAGEFSLRSRIREFAAAQERSGDGDGWQHQQQPQPHSPSTGQEQAATRRMGTAGSSHSSDGGSRRGGRKESESDRIARELRELQERLRSGR